jgi:glycosyltransferase involved in cell wall biosynthesis
LLVAQPTTEGVAVCVRDLAAAGVDAGWDVTVACGASGDLPGWVEAAGARWERLEMARPPRPTDASAVARLRPLLRATDLVHLHSSKAGAVGRIALATLPRRDRPPCAFTPHAWSWWVGGPLEPLYRTFERWAAGRADAIVAVSEEEQVEGADALGRRGGVIRLIENGVDIERFHPRHQAGARGDAPRIACIGRLSRQKGQDVAVAALAMARDRRARLRLIGDGAGDVRASLAEQAAALGVAARVEFAGSVANTAPEYAAADVVIVPSRWDGMSLALLEAMAAGCAIVAADVAGASVLDGAGVLVPPDDATALAAAIDQLLGDPAERARLGDRARALAVERFDARLSAKRTLALWEELAG